MPELVTSDAGSAASGRRAIGRSVWWIDLRPCFCDHRRQDLVEHAVSTLIGQRVFGIALGYEDLNDHDELRHDPVLAVLGGKALGQSGARTARRWRASRR